MGFLFEGLILFTSGIACLLVLLEGTFYSKSHCDQGNTTYFWKEIVVECVSIILCTCYELSVHTYLTSLKKNKQTFLKLECRSSSFKNRRKKHRKTEIPVQRQCPYISFLAVPCFVRPVPLDSMSVSSLRHATHNGAGLDASVL